MKKRYLNNVVKEIAQIAQIVRVVYNSTNLSHVYSFLDINY